MIHRAARIALKKKVRPTAKKETARLVTISSPPILLRLFFILLLLAYRKIAEEPALPGISGFL
jgi:hypothetical protein